MPNTAHRSYSTIAPLISLMLGTAMLHVGLGMQATLLSLRAQTEAFSVLQIGVVMATYYVGFILGTWYSPRLVNRVGHIRAFAALATMASTAPLMHSMVIDPIWWTLFRMISGFCFAGLSLVVESWLNEQTGTHQRGNVLSFYMICVLGGTAIGQLLLNVASPDGFELFVIISVLISVSLIPIVLTRIPMPPIQACPPLSLGHLFTETPLGVVGCLISGLLMGSFWSMAALYAQDTGLNVKGVSLFMASVVAGGLLIQWPLGRLSDLLDRRLVMGTQNLFLALISYILLREFFMPGSLGFYVLTTLLGGLLLPLYALAVANVNDFLEHNEFVSAGALLLLVYGIGAVLGPLLASLFMQIMGHEGLFFMGVAGGLSMGSYAFYRISRRPPPATTENFIAVTGTSHMAYQMDPRSSPNQTLDDEPTG